MPRRPTGRGLRREPEGGWPLDHVLVGLGTLRTARELYRQASEFPASPPRAWDLALWSGVSPQGSVNAMERLTRARLVKELPSGRVGYASSFGLDRGHPLAEPLARLFAAERYMVHRAVRRAIPCIGSAARCGE